VHDGALHGRPAAAVYLHAPTPPPRARESSRESPQDKYRGRVCSKRCRMEGTALHLSLLFLVGVVVPFSRGRLPEPRG
jgi:hypothetical protein